MSITKLPSFSKSILTPLFKAKVQEYTQNLRSNQSSPVQIQYFHDKIEELKSKWDDITDLKVDFIFHQPLTSNTEEQEILSAEFIEQTGCMLLYKVTTPNGPLKIQFDSVTLQVEVFELD